VIGKKKLTTLSQQELLRAAMSELGKSRSEFAARISVSVRTLDKWLLPDDSPDFRSMPDMGRSYILEILEWSRRDS
jgi:transcriptional regulator with XRE-family HTH domain